MAEFEEKLNEILGNQEAMGQIMALARSLSGGGPSKDAGETSGPEEEPPDREENRPEPPTGAGAMPDLSALMGRLDPEMLQTGMRLFREYEEDDGRNAALLAALRPFLKEDRRAKLDRALEIARMTRMIRVALGVMGGKGEDGRV